MSIKLPLEELTSLAICAKQRGQDGKIALSLQPSAQGQGGNSRAPKNPSGISVHFETVEKNGQSTLHVYSTYNPANDLRPRSHTGSTHHAQLPLGSTSASTGSCTPYGMQMDFHSSSNLGLGFSHSDQHQTVNAVSESISGSMNPSAFHYYPSPSLPMSSTPQHEYISAPHPDVDSNFVTRSGQSNQNVAKRS